MTRALRASTLAFWLAVACGATGGAQAPLTLPSPPTAALAAWTDFPVSANPRPIVWLGGPDLIAAYPGEATSKMAGICLKLVVQAGLQLPVAVPPQASARWSSGVTASYRAISAATGFAGLLGMPRDTGSGCDSVAPLVITTVTLGTAGVETDRGPAQLSTWLFQAAGVNGEFAYPALDPSAFWHGGLMPAGNGQGVGGSVSADGRTLIIGISGPPDTPGPCGADYTTATAESDTAVAVAVKMIPHPNSGQVMCNLMAYPRSVTVHLAEPLGARVLVDENGNPGVACPETGGC